MGRDESLAEDADSGAARTERAVVRKKDKFRRDKVRCGGLRSGR
jgi:hypothetical protein